MNPATQARSSGIPGSVLGMVLFITSEVMFFGGLFAAYFTLRSGAPTWPPAGLEPELMLPAAITVLLLTSSYTCHRAVVAATADDLAAFGKWMAVTIALALAFLGGQAYEYTQIHFRIDDGSFGTLFFTMTGFHGAHVLGGVLALSASVLQARRAGTTRGYVGQIEAAGYYWHFVDVIWILLFSTLYLLG